MHPSFQFYECYSANSFASALHGSAGKSRGEKRLLEKSDQRTTWVPCKRENC